MFLNLPASLLALDVPACKTRIWDRQGNMRHEGGPDAYVEPWHNVD
ncbi:hypothetical protein [Brucella intermedia]|nr:hypothetical protein [Brucella intermedia]